MNWTRLEGEAIRDSMLAISGQLQKSKGGPGAFVSLPEDVAGGFEFFKWFPRTRSSRRKGLFTPSSAAR